MRVVIIGAGGMIGRAVAGSLSTRHEIVRVGHTQGQYRVDLASRESIGRLFQELGPCDAIICAAGQAKFGSLATLTDSDFQVSLSNKLMGQVNLVRLGLSSVRDSGSITLTSGVLASEPMPGSAAISLVNAGLEGFVRAAALESPRGIRINAVSPPWVAETLELMGQDRSAGMPAAKVAAAYVESLEGTQTGRIFDARAFA